MSDRLKLIGQLQFIRDYECKTDDEIKTMCKAITLLSEEPERPTGRWIKVNGKTAINCSACYHCSWSLSFEDTVNQFNYCPHCGAKMEVEHDSN